eukprot:2969322-Pleurochrysis_carterae.AAC.1
MPSSTNTEAPPAGFLHLSSSSKPANFTHLEGVHRFGAGEAPPVSHRVLLRLRPRRRRHHLDGRAHPRFRSARTSHQPVSARVVRHC